MATDTQSPDAPQKPAKTWAEVFDNFQHYLAAGVVIFGIGWCVQHELIDKSILGMALVGALTAVGIKVSR